jgi:peptidoglycan/xylan/chitin deacetylase (PgdA/CDA1 family)
LVSALEKAQNPGAAIAPAPAMTPEEAEDCRRRGVELGGHTRAHPSLARIPEPECREEIAGCVRDLRERGFPVRYFAYPFGGPADVGGRGGAPYRVLSELRAGSGIELGLTTEERAVRPTDDPLLVPRKVIMPQTLPQVALKLELLAWRK